MTIWMFVKTQFEGFHQWVDAPDEVSFLRDLHRHIFFIECWVEEKSGNRDIEFISFKRFLIEKLKIPFPLTYSCEQMAGRIRAAVMASYPNRKIKVIVSEDNENGAMVE